MTFPDPWGWAESKGPDKCGYKKKKKEKTEYKYRILGRLVISNQDHPSL